LPSHECYVNIRIDKQATGPILLFDNQNEVFPLFEDRGNTLQVVCHSKLRANKTAVLLVIANVRLDAVGDAGDKRLYVDELYTMFPHAFWGCVQRSFGMPESLDAVVVQPALLYVTDPNNLRLLYRNVASGKSPTLRACNFGATKDVVANACAVMQYAYWWFLYAQKRNDAFWTDILNKHGIQSPYVEPEPPVPPSAAAPEPTAIPEPAAASSAAPASPAQSIAPSLQNMYLDSAAFNFEFDEKEALSDLNLPDSVLKEIQQELEQAYPD
jgi:hypothetical protein